MRLKYASKRRRPTALLAVAAGAFLLEASGGSVSEQEAGFLGPDTFWGAETNGVKAALHISSTYSLKDARAPISCTPILKSSRTNAMWLYLPPKESRFQMHLFDAKGDEVPKTGGAGALGKPLAEPFRLTTGINYRAGYTGVPPLHGQSELLGASEFILQDHFQVTDPGKYRLKFEMIVIWFPPGWKGSQKSTNVPLVCLPPVYADIEMKPINIRK